MLDLSDAWSGAQFFAKLPAFLRKPLTMEAARSMLSDRLHRRGERFLERLRLDVYERPSSPYLQLLRHVGCEYGEIEAGVTRDGLEATLECLFHAGVYLTIDEFKGRRAVRRGNTEFLVTPQLLQAPRASYHVLASSGGSRSKGTPVMIDLAYIRACASNSAISLASRGLTNPRKAVWSSPGSGLRYRMVKYATYGEPTAAAFTQADPSSPDIPEYFRWNQRLLHWGGLLSGRALPWPVYTPLSNPIALARWLQGTLREGRTPHAHTFPGSAVILARWAGDNGYDISGSWFTISGEPITKARLATLRAAGCHAIPRYGSVETGPIGYGCMQPERPDDLHLLHDLHAVIQAGSAGEKAGLPPKALLMTSLYPQSSFVMLNLSMGDQAEFSDRRCACTLTEVGWHQLISNVRSFEKLTGIAVTFDAADVIPILDETLPSLFGGGPTDYQLSESERPDGTPLLSLNVHPRLGELDENAIADEFLRALGSKSASDAMMARRLRDSGTLEVERREPKVTNAGKINYLHMAQ